MKNNLFLIYSVLHRKYGNRNWWPVVRGGKSVYLGEFRLRERTKKEIFEIMTGAILTQNTNWGNAVSAIAELKKKKLLSPAALARLPLDRISAAVKPSGYYRQKAMKLKALSDFILKDLSGDIFFLKSLPLKEAREKLLGIWGVGPETADSILLYGYRMPVFVVDAYTKRIFSRMGFFNNKEDYETVRKYFEDRLERKPGLYMEYHALIVEMGKNICRSKPVCTECPWNESCPSSTDNI